MERRKFMIGLGSAAAGSATLVGSGAFTSVTSTRDVSVRAVNDEDAYLGLTEISDSPNSSYVDENEGHLRIRMDDNNQAEGGGIGVNSDSITFFKDLFRITNQGQQPIKVFVFLIGPEKDKVGLSVPSLRTPCWGLELETGESEDVHMVTSTHGLDTSDPQELVNEMIIVAVGEDNPEDGDHESTAKDLAPDEAEANDELPELN